MKVIAASPQTLTMTSKSEVDVSHVGGQNFAVGFSELAGWETRIIEYSFWPAGGAW